MKQILNNKHTSWTLYAISRYHRDFRSQVLLSISIHLLTHKQLSLIKLNTAL